MNPRLELWDANVMLGDFALRGPGAPTDVPGLLAEMERAGISQALVFSALASAVDPRQGNHWLLKQVANQPRLLPCWVLAPEFSPGASAQAAAEKWVDEMLGCGVRAARLLPREHLFELRPWNIGGLLEVLAERAVPLWIDYGVTSWAVNPIDWNGLAEVLAAFPSLPVVLVRPDISSGRRLFALMERHAMLHIETSYYTVHQGLAEICRLFGARRALFGSGLPWRAAGPAVTMLAYQPLEDEERRLIGGGNLKRLLSEVRL